MKRHTFSMSLMAASLLLGGCGSDDNSSDPVPPNPEDNTPEIIKPSYVFGGPTENDMKLNQTIQFAIVRGFTPIEGWEGATGGPGGPGGGPGGPGGGPGGSGGETGSPGGEAPEEEHVNAPHVNIPVDDVVYTKMVEQAEDLGLRIDYLLPPTAINMAGVDIDTIRPDLFPEGRGSVLDLLLWAAEKYDLDVEIEKDEALNTYFVKSIEGIEGFAEQVDQNRLGETEGQGWKYLVGANILEEIAGGDYNPAYFYYKEEEIYFRIDHHPLKNETSIVLMPAQPGEMDVRKRKYKREMDRLAANGGKVIVPEIVIDFKPEKYDMDGNLVAPRQRAVFKNIEVTPHNLRTDMYQPGVLTELDAWLSLVEQRPDLKMTWSYWPRLSMNANVQGYVASSITFNGVDDEGNVINAKYGNNGECGFVHHTGEWENYADGGSQHRLYRANMCSARLDMGDDWNRAICEGKVPGHLGFRPRHYGAGEKYETHNDPGGLGYWQFGLPFGGNDPHLTGDAMIIYGPEYINYIGGAFGGPNSNNGISSGCDADSPEIDPTLVKDIEKASAPLTEEHFGWKLADCATCHNASNSHVVEDMDPYECAECHGNNGAPNRHEEVYNCGYCHATSLTKHGDLYSDQNDYFSKETRFIEPQSCLTCHRGPEEE